MEKVTIIKKLKDIMGNVLGKELGDFPTDKDLISNLGISSIDALQIFVIIEREFSISINDEDLGIELIKDIDHLSNYILSKVA